MALQGSNLTALSNDDILINGRSYTFQFQSSGMWNFSDKSSTFLADIVQQAPSFIVNPTVNAVASPALATLSLSDVLYNVQFTYEGDNTDLVGDVANSIIAAILAVSNDSVSFVGAVAAAVAAALTITPGSIADAAPGALKDAGQAVVDGAAGATNTVVNAAGGVLKNAAANTAAASNTLLIGGIVPILVVLALIILFVLPSLSKSVRTSGVTFA